MSTIIESIKGRATPMRGSDIDTDRIIPARYLKATRFDTLGEFAFYDERHDSEGNQVYHPLNDSRYAQSVFLIVENNFGCGSSREHAPQSLMRYGFKAFIGKSFAEIFQGNCLALGLPTVTLASAEIDTLMHLVEEHPNTEFILSIKEGHLIVGNTQYTFAQQEGAAQSLLSGTWDNTNLLLRNKAKIEEVSNRLPYIANFQVSSN